MATSASDSDLRLVSQMRGRCSLTPSNCCPLLDAHPVSQSWERYQDKVGECLLVLFCVGGAVIPHAKANVFSTCIAIGMPHHAQGPELDEVTARLKHPERSMDQNDRTAALAGLLPDPLRPPREVQQGCRAMEELAAHLGRYGTLTSLVRQAVGSAVHPYAIDGAALAKALSGEEDSNGSTAGTGVGAVGMGGVGGQGPAGVRPVGVVEVLEGWVEEVEACEGWVSALAGGGSSGNGGGWGRASLRWAH